MTTLPPFTPVTRADAHFSPGYEGEIPNHIGRAEDCAFTECRLAQARHEAAADIQEITSVLFDAPPARHEHLGVWDKDCPSCRADDAVNDDARQEAGR